MTSILSTEASHFVAQVFTELAKAFETVEEPIRVQAGSARPDSQWVADVESGLMRLRLSRWNVRQEWGKGYHNFALTIESKSTGCEIFHVYDPYGEPVVPIPSVAGLGYLRHFERVSLMAEAFCLIGLVMTRIGEALALPPIPAAS